LYRAAALAARDVGIVIAVAGRMRRRDTNTPRCTRRPVPDPLGACLPRASRELCARTALVLLRRDPATSRRHRAVVLFLRRCDHFETLVRARHGRGDREQVPLVLDLGGGLEAD